MTPDDFLNCQRQIHRVARMVLAMPLAEWCATAERARRSVLADDAGADTSGVNATMPMAAALLMFKGEAERVGTLVEEARA